MWVIFENFRFFTRFLGKQPQNNEIFNFIRFCWNLAHRCNFSWRIQKCGPFFKISDFSPDFWENNPNITKFSTSSDFDEILHTEVIFGGEFKNVDQFWKISFIHQIFWKITPKLPNFQLDQILMKFCRQ